MKEASRYSRPQLANVKTERTPKRFIDSPSRFKPKAKLTATLEGPPPNGLGPTAATIKPITSEVGPEEFKKHVVHPGTSGTAQGQASIGPAEQGQASTESTPAGQGKPHLHGGPAMGLPGGSEGPGGPAGQGQASTEIAPTGPGKPHLENTPALGGPQAPVGATGQGQASTEIAPTGPGKPHLKQGRLLATALTEIGRPGSRTEEHPPFGAHAPGGATCDKDRASTEIAPTGPGKPHLKSTPALGGPQAPVGADWTRTSIHRDRADWSRQAAFGWRAFRPANRQAPQTSGMRATSRTASLQRSGALVSVRPAWLQS